MIVAILKIENGNWTYEDHIRDSKFACVIYFWKIWRNWHYNSLRQCILVLVSWKLL